MKRYDILDGFRGYFLVFMLVNHLAFQGGSWIARLNHAELGYVQDAQGFIFISGLIVGLHYGSGYLKGRYAATDRRIAARIGLLFGYTWALLALIFGLALVLPSAHEYWGHYFPDFFGDPATTAVGALVLTYQPTFMDILPQYILYLLAAPLLIRLIMAGRGLHVLAASVLCWLAVQFGLHLPLISGMEWLGQTIDPDFVTRSSFKPLAWQIVFVSGLLIGGTLLTGGFRVNDWFDPRRPAPFLLAIGLVLAFMAYRFGFASGFLPETLGERFLAHDNRNEFSLVYLVNFAALGYAVAWLLLCGDRAGSWLLRLLHRALRRLFHLRFLRFIGQHSLQVYVYHVALIYLVFLLDGAYGPFSQWTKAAITIAGVASLALPAWLHARWKDGGERALRLRPASA